MTEQNKKADLGCASDWSKHHNPDRTISIYKDGKFVAAIENTTASCDLFYQFSTEIKRLEAELDKLKRANEIAVRAFEKIGCDCGYDAVDGYGDSTCIPCSALSEIKRVL